MGYHIQKITKGELGEISKIEEEVMELKDASEQGCKILEMVELSDLYGAIEEYAMRKYGLQMEDLKKMSDRTKEAFRSGDRK